MVEHDAHVGQLLDKLKELGIDDNTIVMYSTDNGAEKFTWPDGGTSPFRGEKNTNWEGGYRVPCVIRWPGVIKPGTVLNDVFAHEDMLPTLLAAAGVPERQGAADEGHEGRRQDLQGPPRRLRHHRYARRQDARARATSSSTSTTTARSSALRYDQWKIVFAEQRAHGLRRLAGPVRAAARFRSSSTSAPIRSRSPTTRASTTERGGSTTSSCSCRRSNTSGSSSPPSRNFRPSQKAGSFSLDQALESLQNTPKD